MSDPTHDDIWQRVIEQARKVWTDDQTAKQVLDYVEEAVRADLKPKSARPYTEPQQEVYGHRQQPHWAVVNVLVNGKMLQGYCWCSDPVNGPHTVRQATPEQVAEHEADLKKMAEDGDSILGHFRGPRPGDHHFYLWSEGYHANEGRGGAQYLGEAWGTDLADAATRWYDSLRNPMDYGQLTITKGVPSIWACRIFDNEYDARRSFG